MNIMYNCEVEIEGVMFKVSFDNGSFSLPKGPVSLHNHGAYEAHVIENGEFAFRIDGRDIILQKGKCCVISPDSYRLKANALTPGSCKYCFKFEYVCNEKGSSGICEGLEKINDVSTYGNCTNEIGLLKSLESGIGDKRLGHRTNIKNLSSQLIISLLRNLSGNAAGVWKSQTADAYETCIPVNT